MGPFKFSDIKEPRVLCLVVLYGGGTKLVQSYLDGHPEVYNIPAYPLVYLYPHWKTWEEEYQEIWNWDTIINIFCIKHASVIDSRKIRGLNGLDILGEEKDEYVAIKEDIFRHYLKEILKNEPISRRTFLLAVNYAYALCKGEDLSQKKVLIWHHHVFEFLDEFVKDFPEATILGFIRDPRAKIYRHYIQNIKEDKIKLNMSDAMIYHSYVFHHVNKFMFVTPHSLRKFINPSRMFFLRHEDIALDQKRVVERLVELLDIRYMDLLLDTTFDGKIWWGHDIYVMPEVGTQGLNRKEQARLISQKALKRVLVQDWKKEVSPVEIFVLEGMMYDFYVKSGYSPVYYKKDNWTNRACLMVAILLPFKIELRDLGFYLNPANHWELLKVSWWEALGKLKRKYYGFSAVFFYKRTYKDFRLWENSWAVKLLESKSRIGAVAYVIWNYIRFLTAILCLPLQYARRLGMYYQCFFRRLTGNNFMSRDLFDKEMAEESQEKKEWSVS